MIDSHMFLRLVTSFEPWYLSFNFLAWLFGFAVHNVGRWSNDNTVLPVSDFGAAEWMYCILHIIVHFIAMFPFACGYQDSYTHATDDPAATLYISGISAFYLVCIQIGYYVGGLPGLGDFNSDTVFKGHPWAFTTGNVFYTTSFTLMLYQLKFAYNAWREPGCYVVVKPLMRPCEVNPKHTHQRRNSVPEQIGDVFPYDDHMSRIDKNAELLTPVSFALLKCAREKLIVAPCILQKDIVPALRFRDPNLDTPPCCGYNKGTSVTPSNEPDSVEKGCISGEGTCIGVDEGLRLLKRVLHNLGGWQKHDEAHEKELREAVALCDVTGDGLLDEKEFILILKRFALLSIT